MADSGNFADAAFSAGGYQQSGENLSFIDERDAEDDIAKRVMRDVTDATGMVLSQKNESAPCFKYYNGNQWADLDRMRMEQLKRPALTMNEIQPTINAISGLERLNRMGVN